jgi:hypothetical protein
VKDRWQMKHVAELLVLASSEHTPGRKRSTVRSRTRGSARVAPDSSRASAARWTSTSPGKVSSLGSAGLEHTPGMHCPQPAARIRP